MMVGRTDLLAEVMTLELGKPLAEARGEVGYAADLIRWFAEEAVRIDGGHAHWPDGAARNIQLKQPVGPCLLIVPWNFPLAMGARKVGPAIAAGCTSILKPAPQTPLSSLALTQLLVGAGLPPGVLNVPPTSRDGEIVEPLLGSGVIRKLSFTGSTAVGKLLLGQASRNVVRTSMELGGDAPFLVLEDADLEIAVDAAFAAKMRNMGEACTAANRFLVHVDVAEEFASRLGERMSALTVGDGLEDGVEVGPLIDQQARNKVQGLVRDALDRGATLVAGGRCPDRPGYFVEPTVLSDVHPDGALDSTRLGTRRLPDHPRPRPALNVSEQLEVGMVGLNTGIVSTPSAPSAASSSPG